MSAPPDETSDDASSLLRLADAGQRAAAALHDLRNPLGVIETSAFLLAQWADAPREIDREKLRKQAKRIAEQVSIASALIAEVLDATRAQPAQLVTSAVRALVDAASPPPDGAAAPSGARVECELPPSLPSVRVDVFRARRILVVLLENARDACAQRDSTAKIYLRAWHDSDRVCIAVADDGPGIAPLHHARLFEPLFTTKGARGHGLGLASARALAHSMGATLTARNATHDDAPARGAVFELSLPTAPNSAQDGAESLR